MTDTRLILLLCAVLILFAALVVVFTRDGDRPAPPEPPPQVCAPGDSLRRALDAALADVQDLQTTIRALAERRPPPPRPAALIQARACDAPWTVTGLTPAQAADLVEQCLRRGER